MSEGWSEGGRASITNPQSPLTTSHLGSASVVVLLEYNSPRHLVLSINHGVIATCATMSSINEHFAVISIYRRMYSNYYKPYTVISISA